MNLFNKEIKRNNLPQIFNLKPRNKIQRPYLLNYHKNKVELESIDKKENEKILAFKNNKRNISFHKNLFLSNEDNNIFLNDKKINNKANIRVNNSHEIGIKNNLPKNNINLFKEKVNRQNKYSINIRKRINENIKGAKILNNPYLFFPYISKKNELNNFNKNKIFKTINEQEKNRRKNRFKNFGKMILLNKNEKSRKRIRESNKKSKNNYYKIGNKIYNNLGINIFNNKGGENIFKKEEYSDMVRIRNVKKYQKQRQKKLKDYFNKIENNPRNIELNKIFNKTSESSEEEEEEEDEEEEDEEDEDDEGEDDEDEDDEDEDDEDDEEDEEEESNSSDDNDESDEDSDISNESLDDEIIENLNVIKYNEREKLSDENKKCAICLENFGLDDNCICLPCIHIFHEQCIKNWLKRRNICPICRFKITSESIKKKTN